MKKEESRQESKGGRHEKGRESGGRGKTKVIFVKFSPPPQRRWNSDASSDWPSSSRLVGGHVPGVGGAVA